MKVLGETFSVSILIVFVDICFVKTGTLFVTAAVISLTMPRSGTFLLAVPPSAQVSLVDLVAYSGYKFVGVIVTLFLSEILTGGRGTGNWIGWALFLYLWSANAFFLVRSIIFIFVNAP